jgi:hypothetical protein
MSLACIFVLGFDQSDWLKLMGIVGAMLVLYMLARKLSGAGEAVPPPSEIATPVEVQNETMVAPHVEELDEDDPDQFDDDIEQITEPERPQPRNIQIGNWNFEHFDIATGPPDPDNFADELLMELHDSSAGRSWRQTYFVATPAGLQKMLRSKKWSSMVLPQTLVMARYDLKELRAAILDELGAMEAQRGDAPDEPSETPAAGGSGVAEFSPRALFPASPNPGKRDHP